MEKEKNEMFIEIFAENEKRLNEYLAKRENRTDNQEVRGCHRTFVINEAPSSYTGYEVVNVVGMPDIACEGIDFMKSCLLNESLEIARERYAKLTEREKRFYYISVCQGTIPIYSIYQDEIMVEDAYKYLLQENWMKY